MTRDIPIIFSGPMVCALLDGRKTMTRRLAWQSVGVVDGHKDHERKGWREGYDNEWFRPSPWQKVKPGDRMWVRESLRFDDDCDKAGWRYAADESDLTIPRLMGAWHNEQKRLTIRSIHMPRWASRLTLIVTATKIERLQKISEADALAEGCEVIDALPSAAFRSLWRHIHGAESWDANPEVVALSFTVHKQNIDTLPKAEAA